MYKINVPPLNRNYAWILEQNGFNLSMDTSKVKNELLIIFQMVVNDIVEITYITFCLNLSKAVVFLNFYSDDSCNTYSNLNSHWFLIYFICKFVAYLVLITMGSKSWVLFCFSPNLENVEQIKTFFQIWQHIIFKHKYLKIKTSPTYLSTYWWKTSLPLCNSAAYFLLLPI